MKTFLLMVLSGLILCTGAHAVPDSFIRLRLSYHVVVNNAGVRPSATLTDQALIDAVNGANAWLAKYQRGYRLELVGGINEIGKGKGALGPAKWYGVPITYDNVQEFNDNAQSNPDYLWNPSAVNVFITKSPAGGGLASFPCNPYSVVWLENPLELWVVLHEVGHFYALAHTHDDMGCLLPTHPGNGEGDSVADTLPDPGTTREGIATANFGGRTYSVLTAAEKALVDNVYFNVMGYYNVSTRDTVNERMTEGQLDRLADVASQERAATASGKMIFFGGSVLRAGAPLGSSERPHASLTNAVAAANPSGNDIIILRPGAYATPLTLNKPCTLRATRSITNIAEGPIRNGRVTLGSTINH